LINLREVEIGDRDRETGLRGLKGVVGKRYFLTGALRDFQPMEHNGRESRTSLVVAEL